MRACEMRAVMCRALVKHSAEKLPCSRGADHVRVVHELRKPLNGRRANFES